jgi:hypothetical protein
MNIVSYRSKYLNVWIWYTGFLSRELYRAELSDEPYLLEMFSLYGYKHENVVQFVQWNMSYGLEMCSSYLGRTAGWGGGGAELSVSSAVSE